MLSISLNAPRRRSTAPSPIPGTGKRPGSLAGLYPPGGRVCAHGGDDHRQQGQEPAEIAACRALAEGLGAVLRIREYIPD